MTVQAVADALNRPHPGYQSPVVDFINWKPEGHEFTLDINGEEVKAVIVENQSINGDDWTQRVWFTFQIGERYFRRYGMYQSHVGEDWEYGQTEEVFPQTRVIEGFFPA